MTERLALLLHDEAQALHVPPPPTELLLARGRRERRRRTALTGLAAAAVLAVVGGSVALTTGWDRDRGSIEPATPPGIGPAYSVNDTVHVGAGDVTAKVDGTVHSFHYTSVGVIVRSNDHGGLSDWSGPEVFTFVAPDGATEELGTFPEGWGPATAPDSPVFALAEIDTGAVSVVLRDAATGEVTDRIAVPGTYSNMPWPVPPLAMSEGVVYVPMEGVVKAVDVSTGTVTDAPHLEPGSLPEVVAGLQSSYAGGSGTATLVDVATGAAVLEADTGRHGHLAVSPDGRYAMAVREDVMPGDEGGRVTVYTVATGEKVTVPGEPWDLGWTSDGRLFSVDSEDDIVTTCDPATGTCEERAAGLPDVSEPSSGPTTTCRGDGCMTTETDEATIEVRLGGRAYES